MVTPEFMRNIFHSAATIANNQSKGVAERELLRRKNSMERSTKSNKELRIQEKQELNSLVHDFKDAQNQNQYKKMLHRVLHVLLPVQFSMGLKLLGAY